MMATKTARDEKVPELHRQAFRTSRLLDFLSEKELVAQTGHSRAAWPLVLVKELLDNALDACEEAGIAPKVAITVDDLGLTITDNGPGIPPDVVKGILDYSVRVSSREAYVSPPPPSSDKMSDEAQAISVTCHCVRSPCRGAQGNALKTVISMPHVLDGERGRVTICAQGVRHEITLAVDRIRQEPVIDQEQHSDDRFVKNGTSITVHFTSLILRRRWDGFANWR